MFLRAVSLACAGAPSARLAQAAARDPNDLDEIEALARRTQTALRQLETALSRAQ